MAKHFVMMLSAESEHWAHAVSCDRRLWDQQVLWEARPPVNQLVLLLIHSLLLCYARMTPMSRHLALKRWTSCFIHWSI